MCLCVWQTGVCSYIMAWPKVKVTLSDKTLRSHLPFTIQKTFHCKAAYHLRHTQGIVASHNRYRCILIDGYLQHKNFSNVFFFLGFPCIISYFFENCLAYIWRSFEQPLHAEFKRIYLIWSCNIESLIWRTILLPLSISLELCGIKMTVVQ